jgi:hypothetical protein
MADEKKITGKKSNIKLNPRTEEIMERHRKLAEESLLSKLGNLREEQDDFDCLYVDEFTDEELEEIAEEVLSELDSEQREEIFEAIESDLLEVISERMDPKEIQRRRDQAKDRLQTGASMKKAADKSAADKAKPSRGSRLKSALKSAAKKVASSAGKVAGEFSAAKAKQKEKAMSRPSSDSSSSSSGGNSNGGGSSSGSSSSTSSSSSTTSSAPRERKRDKIKRALKKGIGKVARAVSRGARGVARRMGEDFKGFSDFVSEGSCGGGYSYGGKVAKKSMGGKTAVKKEDAEVEAEEITEKKSDEGFAGEATSYKGVVVKRTESGYEAPRFNLVSKSLDSLKANIDKEIAKVESYQPDAANNYNGPLYAPWSAVEEGKKKGLWANIHAKRKRGEKPAKPGDKDYPETLKVEEAPKYDKEGNDKYDRSKRMIRHKQKKYGVSTFKQRLMTGADHNTDNEKKAKMKKEETVIERADTWHPDPEKDRKLGGPGANQRAREDRAAASKPAAKKEDPKKLRKGESYMDYAKRQKGYTPAKKKEGIGSKIKRKLGLKKESVLTLSFSEFMDESRRGPEDPSKAAKREKAQKSYDAVKKRQKVLDKHEKKTGTKLDIKKSVEGKRHKMNHPGSRQKPKVKGEKETELQQHNRRVSKHNDRLIKKGPTTKEKKKQAGYDAYEKKHKRGNRSVWD